jgi:DNA-binding MarR family transcriptional regulator
MQSEDQRILALLFEKGQICFQEVYLAEICGNRNTLHKKLIELEGRGFVKKKNAKKRGRKVFFSLTEKGEDKYLHLAADELTTAFKTAEKILTQIRKDPARIEKWRERREEAFFSLEIPGDMSIDQRTHAVREHVQQHQENWDRTILRCLRAIHEVFLQMTFGEDLGRPNAADSLVGIKKVGDTYQVRVLPEKVYLQSFPEA